MKLKRTIFAIALSVLILSFGIFGSLAEGAEPAAEPAAADNGSKLAAFFKSLDPEKGIHIITKSELLGLVTTVESQSKGQHYYSTTTIEGYPSDGSFKLYSDNRLYNMNADKTGYYVEVSEAQAMAQQIASELTGEEVELPEAVEIWGASFDTIYSSMGAHIYETGYETLQQEVNGVVYAAEKYAAQSEYGVDQTFCFDESGRLVYVLDAASELFGTPEIVYSILQLDDVVDESLFDTTGFEAVDYQTYMNSLLKSMGNG